VQQWLGDRSFHDLDVQDLTIIDYIFNNQIESQQISTPPRQNHLTATDHTYFIKCNPYCTIGVTYITQTNRPHSHYAYWVVDMGEGIQWDGIPPLFIIHIFYSSIYFVLLFGRYNMRIISVNYEKKPSTYLEPLRSNKAATSYFLIIIALTMV